MNIIAIEGIDASGKQTQVQMLFNALSNMGFKVAVDSFPRYSTPLGKLIKQWLNKEIEISKEAIRMLYEADRQDYQSEIQFLAEEGFDFLLLDRYHLSNLAFGMAEGVDITWLQALQTKIRKPDLTIVLDISSQTSFSRKSERDRYEVDSELLVKARNAYLFLANKLSKENDDLIYVINSDQALPTQIHESILSTVEMLII